MNKTDAMKELISEINPFVEVEIKNEYVTEKNALSIFKDVDIVLRLLITHRLKLISECNFE
jgi:sulfur carrier protein ThiS adenylyltransferase